VNLEAKARVLHELVPGTATIRFSRESEHPIFELRRETAIGRCIVGRKVEV